MASGQLPSVMAQTVPRPGSGCNAGLGLGSLASFSVPRKQVPTVPQEIAAPHPFDGPYAVMKALQTEVDNLKVELKTEKIQRQTEHKRHEEQLGWLRDALTRERSERTASFDTIKTLLSEECARSKADSQDLRAELAEGLKRRPELGDFNALHNRVTELAQMVEEEVSSRQVKCDRLDELIAANTTADAHFARHALQELAMAKEQLEENSAGDRHFQENVLPRMAAAGRAMQAGDRPSPTLPGTPLSRPRTTSIGAPSSRPGTSGPGAPIAGFGGRDTGEHAAAATAAASAVAAATAAVSARVEPSGIGRGP